MDKIGVVTFEKYRGQNNIGSSKIRGHWLIDAWEGAEECVQGKKYDVVIYQKAYMVEHAKHFDGIKIFDTCDPDFLHWGYQTVEMINECDGVTTSTEALAEAIRGFTDKPVLCIPDRMNLNEFNESKIHEGVAKWAVWFGYSSNFPVLKPVVPILKRLNLNLMVISDGGFSIGSNYQDSVEIRNLPFNWQTVEQDIKDGDLVLNPQSDKGKWRFKSNNKTLMGWALGMPVAHDLESLKSFINPEARIKEQVQRRKELEEKWDIKYSVDEYKAFIESLRSN